jgi:hypothetical protein
MIRYSEFAGNGPSSLRRHRRWQARGACRRGSDVVVVRAGEIKSEQRGRMASTLAQRLNDQGVTGQADHRRRGLTHHQSARKSGRSLFRTRTSCLPVSAASSTTALPIQISAHARWQPKRGSRCDIRRNSLPSATLPAVISSIRFA